MGVSPNEEHQCKLLGKGNNDHIPLKLRFNCFFSQRVGFEKQFSTGNTDLLMFCFKDISKNVRLTSAL